MKEELKKTINFINNKISFITNDQELLTKLQEELKDYFEFSRYQDNEISLKVLMSKQLYNKYFKLARKNKLKKQGIFLDVRRENIIMMDSKSLDITVLYDEYTDSKLQHIEEILLGIFGKIIEDQGYYFLHSSCVTKNERGILIVGDKHTGKTSLLMNFLNHSYNFVANSHVGIKCDEEKMNAIGFPSRIGLRVETLFMRNIK